MYFNVQWLLMSSTNGVLCPEQSYKACEHHILATL